LRLGGAFDDSQTDGMAAAMPSRAEFFREIFCRPAFSLTRAAPAIYLRASVFSR